MDFHEILYKVLIVEKRMSVRSLANKVNVPETTFYARLRGKGSFKPDEARRISNVLCDPELTNWFLRDGQFVAVSRFVADKPSINQFETLRQTALKMLIEATEATHQLEKALEDQKIDHLEAKLIRTDIEKAELAIATLREHVNQVAAK